MIVFRSPKGWTCPVSLDGFPVEGTCLAHRIPFPADAAHPEHIALLESWMRSYHPEELFDENGRLVPELRELAPVGNRRMGSNPHANGGQVLRDLRRPDFRSYAVDVPSPGDHLGEDMHQLGKYMRDVVRLNMEAKNFRIFAPDEAKSNGLEPVFEVTGRRWNTDFMENDLNLDTEGRVMDAMLSEHMCQGWLRGYLLTGRHGAFVSYEAFIRIVDSMVSSTPSGSRWPPSCPGGRISPP